MDNTYDTRSVSTLTNESFFSDLTHMDKESSYYPKACNIPKIMGKVVTLNYLKHKPEKNYVFKPTAKGTYPVHILETDDDTLANEVTVMDPGLWSGEPKNF